MPVFLLVILFLIYLIQTTVTAMALHGALSQTARQTASQWYPIEIARGKVADTKTYQTYQDWESKLGDVRSTAAEYGAYLPSPLSDWIEKAGDGFGWTEQAAGQAIEPLVRRLADRGVLDESRIRVVAAKLPLDEGSEDFVTLEAEYILPMRVPFLNRSLKLRESARERAWLGGSPSNARLSDEEGEQKAESALSFVSLEPNPVSRGRKVTLKLRAEPGETVDMSVLYKSGMSQAKHLGPATADASGIVAWTWHVSGNTTPGEWSWEARQEDGETLRMTFEVVRPGGK